MTSEGVTFAIAWAEKKERTELLEKVCCSVSDLPIATVRKLLAVLAEAEQEGKENA